MLDMGFEEELKNIFSFFKVRTYRIVFLRMQEYGGIFATRNYSMINISMKVGYYVGCGVCSRCLLSLIKYYRFWM